jgi:3-hydroxyacyl-[acyl-carrier-protein] dehydratase
VSSNESPFQVEPSLAEVERTAARQRAFCVLWIDQDMTSAEIERAIPHRPPMRLLDEIVEQSDRKIHCRKAFRHDEFFVQGHFPEQPIVPGVIQCECCLQAGAVLLSQFTPQEPGVVPVATRLDNVRFKQMVRPGDTIDIEVELVDQVSHAYFLTGRVKLEGKVAARLDFACSIARPRVE